MEELSTPRLAIDHVDLDAGGGGGGGARRVTPSRKSRSGRCFTTREPASRSVLLTYRPCQTRPEGFQIAERRAFPGAPSGLLASSLHQGRDGLFWILAIFAPLSSIARPGKVPSFN